ncbi:3257_t:CDS:2, partial [Paraglomus occultum]
MSEGFARRSTNRKNKKLQQQKQKAIPLPVYIDHGITAAFRYLTSFFWSGKSYGIFDRASRSVWVSKQEDIDILWRQGFFGKGTLSRSEPLWACNYDKISSRNVVGGQLVKTDGKLSGISADEETSTVCSTTVKDVGSAVEIVDPSTMERLQLHLEEAMFLLYGLGILDICDVNKRQLSIEECWTEFCLAGHEPPTDTTEQQSNLDIDWNNSFIIYYTVYHYFRSLGWVVKDGTKYGVDYLLYEKGPPFNHSQYAVVIVPVHDAPGTKSSNSEAPLKLWQSIMSLSRVCGSVRKTIVLCHVIIPDSNDVLPTHSPECVKMYAIKEIVINRFLPEK